MFVLTILSTLIFSLLIIIYHKLTGSVNLCCQSAAAAAWDSFNGHMNHVITNFVPTKCRQSKQSNNKSSKFKRYPRFLTKLLAKKLRCWHRYKSCPNDVTKATYYKSSTDARSAICNHHKNVEKKIIDSKNVGSFYKFVNNKLSCISGNCPNKKR